MVIQFIATGIIVIILGQLGLKVIKDKTSVFKLMFWGIFWAIALVFIWLPTGLLDKLGELFGVGRGVDVLVYLSIIFLFYTNLRLNNKVEKLEKEITKLVREIARNRTNS